MEKIKVLLISTKSDIKNKLEIVNLLLKNAKNFEISLYSNKQIDEIKNVEIFVQNVSKQELQNTALNNVSQSVILLDLDYNEEVLQQNLESILENYKNNDIVNFTNSSNKFIKFFQFIKFYIINFILSLFNIQPMLNINPDFQYLSSSVTKVMSKISKSPNYLRLFNNFSGYNQICILNQKEKVKVKKDIKFLLLAFFLIALAIISVALTIYLGIIHHASPNVSKMVLAEILIFMSLIILALCAFTYHNYINKI